MNGKGSQTRKGANLKTYWDNYDSIFRKPETTDENKVETKSEEPAK